MANTNFFVAKNGLAVGNTTSIKQIVNNAGQWIGDPTGVIQDGYDKANSANVLAQSAYTQANTANSIATSAGIYANTGIVLAQAAFDKANTDNSLAQYAFDGANSSNILAQAAFDKANTDNSLAQFAYNEANTAHSVATNAGVYANTGITIGQAAYDAANNVGPQVQPAFDTANAAFNQANLSNSLAQSGYDQANTGLVLAQDAYDFANTIAISSGLVGITDDNTTNNVLYINFTDNTTGNLITIHTSSEKLTYNPSSGTLGVNSINLSASSNMAANGVNLSSTSLVTIDSLPATLYRSAFYQVQISSGLEFHTLNLNVVHNDVNVFLNTFGDTYTLETLGTFGANIVDNQLNIQFTPRYSSTTVSFIRNAIAKMGVEVPSDSLGFVGDPVTVFFDAGYDADPVGTQWDYGTVG